MKTVDGRGRACPEPVLLTKRALEQEPGEPLQVLVDTPVARDNISRFVRNAGYQLEVQKKGDDYLILVTPGGR